MLSSVNQDCHNLVLFEISICPTSILCDCMSGGLRLGFCLRALCWQSLSYSQCLCRTYKLVLISNAKLFWFAVSDYDIFWHLSHKKGTYSIFGFQVLSHLFWPLLQGLYWRPYTSGIHKTHFKCSNYIHYLHF